jgi:hypothetical protein
VEHYPYKYPEVSMKFLEIEKSSDKSTAAGFRVIIVGTISAGVLPAESRY